MESPAEAEIYHRSLDLIRGFLEIFRVEGVSPTMQQFVNLLCLILPVVLILGCFNFSIGPLVKSMAKTPTYAFLITVFLLTLLFVDEIGKGFGFSIFLFASGVLILENIEKFKSQKSERHLDDDRYLD